MSEHGRKSDASRRASADDRARHARLSDLVARAQELSPSGRGAFLDAECAGDPTLRDEVLAYLRELDETAEQGLVAGIDAAVGGVARDFLRSRAGDPRPLGPPRELGPYRLIELLGKGGMGEVWLAEQDRPIRRRVAIKLIKPGLDTERVLVRFEAERQALAMMDHPAVAKVFDAGATPEGRPFFVMEHVPGVPIIQHSDQARLSLRERAALLCAVCAGVQHAHHKGVIHRDLKPSNVLVRLEEGAAMVKIIDFGLAKSMAQRLTDRSLESEIGATIGTPEYMSPEQFDARGDVDTRTDVYSLGVMLYELLVGALPFEPEPLRAAGWEGISCRVREQQPPTPSARVSSLGPSSADLAARRRLDRTALRRQLAGELDWIVMKALERDRTRRYGSPSELAADLGRYLADEPVLAGPPSRAYQARKFVRRHRVGVAAAALALLAPLAIASNMREQAHRVARERDRAESERKRAEEVATFLSEVLGDVDPGRFGARLDVLQRQRIAELRRGRGASEEEITQVLTAYDETLAGINQTDTARALLDEEILARAGARIEATLTGDPILAGRLEHTLADVAERLALLDNAAQHARRAVAIREASLGDEAPETLRSRRMLARVFTRQGRLSESEPLLLRTIAAQRRLLGDDHPDTLASSFDLAAVAMWAGRWEEAERMLRATLEGQRRVLGRHHDETIETQLQLGQTVWRQHRDAEGIAEARAALDLVRRAHGEEHRQTTNVMKTLGGMLSQTGQHVEAEELQRRALEVRRRLLGEQHRDTADAASALAHTLSRQGRRLEALPLFHAALAVLRRSPGEESPTGQRLLEQLAMELSTLGRWDDAEPVVRRLTEIRRRVRGERDPFTLASRRLQAEVWMAAGRPAEAVRELRELLAIHAELGEDRYYFKVESDLGDALRRVGQLDEAAVLLARSYAGLARLHPETQPIQHGQDFVHPLARPHAALAGLYAARGDLDRAAEHLRSAVFTLDWTDASPLDDRDLTRHRGHAGIAEILAELRRRLEWPGPLPLPPHGEADPPPE